MANWNGSARSNYFQVKDEAAFREWAEKRELHVLEGTRKKDSSRLFGFYSEDQYGGWPSYNRELEEKTGDGSIDLAAEIATHLQPGEIAVLEEIGAEKLCYLTGIAVAVDHTGKSVDISLDEIYQRASDAFVVPVNQISQCTS